MIHHIPTDLRTLLAQAATICARYDARLWLVGGVIRDLLLGVPLGRDVDLAIEGDVATLVDALADGLGGRVLARHDAFGTASIQVGAQTFDLARTRIESYPQPAVLPTIAPAPIEADLIRRDFSINAMALPILPHHTDLQTGPLFDPFNGQSDLSNGYLRLLHDQSLRDDPTRILRGLRLAARLNLSPTPETQAQIAYAVEVGYLQLLTAERILAELCLALEEPAPQRVLKLADSWGVTPQIAPELRLNDTLLMRCERILHDTDPPAADAHRPLVWLGLFCYDMQRAERSAIAARYPLPSAPATLLHELSKLPGIVPELQQSVTNSQIARLLRPFGTTALSVLHYAMDANDLRVDRYLRQLRHIRAPIDGNDLQRMGIPPGPALGRLLNELRDATLDGQISNRNDAEAWVKIRFQSTAHQ